MTAVLSNNAESRLAVALAADATTLSVSAGEGAKFPSLAAGSGNWFPLTLVKASSALEIVRCTERSGDVFTIVRAQEGTEALSFTAGDRVDLRMTTAVVDEINTRIAQAEQALADYIASLGLTGAVMPFPRSTAPTGWLKCNGQAVSRTTYAALFAVIGTTFGAGNGTTTFNLPDMRGETVRGWDDGRGVDTGRAMGSAQAAQGLAHTHTGTTSSDSHNHTFSGTTSTNGNHTHSTSGAPGSGAANYFAYQDGGAYTRSTDPAGNHNHTFSGTTSSDAHTHTFTTSSSGGADMRVRNVALLYCIKT